MPALAGVFRLDYAAFTRFNALGVALGIGQFILIGYFFGRHLPELLAMMGRFGGWGVVSGVAAVGLADSCRHPSPAAVRVTGEAPIRGSDR